MVGVDSDNFSKWTELFVQYVSNLTEEGRKVLLMSDWYRAHKTLRVLQLFERNGIDRTPSQHIRRERRRLVMSFYSVSTNAH